MGKEIRRVPPNWEHPLKYESHKDLPPYERHYQPMYDRTYGDAIKEWIAWRESWLKGEHPDQIRKANDVEFNKNYPPDDYGYLAWFWSPPDPEYYRPPFEEEPTWYQVYQTVSEGTPVTPPFATKEELVDYLVEHGDYWHQRSVAQSDEWTVWNVHTKPSRAAAEAFVEQGSAFSMVVFGGGTPEAEILHGMDAVERLAKED